MESKFARITMVFTVSLGMMLAACAKKAVTDAASTTDGTGTGGGGGATNQLTSYVGIWTSSCAASANVNGASAWVKKTFQVSSDGTGNYSIVYYNNSSCSGGAMIWEYTPVTITYVSDTTAPANGKLFRIATGTGQSMYSQNAAGASHLNAGGTGCSYNMFANVGGLTTSGGFTCSGDSRLDMVASGASADLVMVKSGATLATTSMSGNVPGLTVGTAEAATTTNWN